MTGDGRSRFLRSIAEHIDADRVEEVHLFPAIRQGGRESGVAVITLLPEVPAEVETAIEVEGAVLADEAAGSGEEVEAVDAADAGDVAGVKEVVEMGEVLDVGETVVSGNAADAGEPVAVDAIGVVSADAPSPSVPRLLQRYVVLRANYRLTLKGPDRGKWEVGVVEEADAPASTIAEVVRGVQERSGDWGGGGAGGDDETPERLTGDGFRAALTEVPWTTKQ
ncbi:MAG TPA: hypothetical protein VIQ74_18115 [Gemmatimonadaceae bacterium]|jgi:hypothetical protein